MNKTQKFLLKNEKLFKHSLIAIGVSLILIGIFVDFSWLKAIADSYAADGICEPCNILNPSFMILPIGGSAIIIFAIKYLNDLLNRTNDLKKILGLAIFFALVLYLMSSQIRYFDDDEHEHLHKAWLLQEKIIPFISVNSMHTPLLEWLIVLFMQITGESITIVQTMRVFIFFVSCSSLCLTYIIIKELFQSKINALLGVLLIISNLVWIHKSPEIRPDNIMLFFVLLSFWILIKYYKNPKTKYLFMFGLCAFLSMLGKQNAAIFYFALGVVFGYDAIFKRKLLNKKTIIFGIISVVILFQIDVIREFFMVNIMRHIIPNESKFLPDKLLAKVWLFNPAIFLLFIFQLFSPIKFDKKYDLFKKYLIGVSFTCFAFLFFMNFPWLQEMLVMVVFMGILASNMLAEIIHKLNWKLGYILVGAIIMPTLILTTHTVLFRTFTDDIETTKTILEISKGDELVFDAYGKAIFRHHPLDPKHLKYSSKKFNSLCELKKSNVKFIIKDSRVYPKLPKETLNWFQENFIQTNENPNIFVRINYAYKKSELVRPH